MYVHEKGTLPLVQDFGFDLAPGMKYLIQLKLIKVNTNVDIFGYISDQEHCGFRNPHSPCLCRSQCPLPKIYISIMFNVRLCLKVLPQNTCQNPYMVL